MLARGGWYPTTATGDVRAAFARGARGFEGRLARIAAQNAEPGELRPGALAALRQLEGSVSAAGAELVVLCPPTDHGNPVPRRLLESGAIRRVLLLDDPARFPELFDAANRTNEEHLNFRGAELFSAAFAAEFAREFAPPRR